MTLHFERIPCTAAEGCDRMSTRSNGLCEKHALMLRRYGRTYKVREPNPDGKWFSDKGYVMMWYDGKEVREHVHLAEKALGKSLPKGAEVHHMNNKPWDNHTPLNLIVCPSRDYHMLLHRRAKELGYENN